MFPLDGDDAGDEEEKETRRDYGLHLLRTMRLRTSANKENRRAVKTTLRLLFILQFSKSPSIYTSIQFRYLYECKILPHKRDIKNCYI